jgi:hypothetical protein
LSVRDLASSGGAVTLVKNELLSCSLEQQLKARCRTHESLTHQVDYASARLIAVDQTTTYRSDCVPSYATTSKYYVDRHQLPLSLQTAKVHGVENTFSIPWGRKIIPISGGREACCIIFIDSESYTTSPGLGARTPVSRTLSIVVPRRSLSHAGPLDVFATL